MRIVSTTLIVRNVGDSVGGEPCQLMAIREVFHKEASQTQLMDRRWWDAEKAEHLNSRGQSPVTGVSMKNWRACAEIVEREQQDRARFAERP